MVTKAVTISIASPPLQKQPLQPRAAKLAACPSHVFFYCNAELQPWCWLGRSCKLWRCSCLAGSSIVAALPAETGRREKTEQVGIPVIQEGDYINREKREVLKKENRW